MLWAVQELDTALTQLEHQREHLPERAATRAAMAEVAVMEKDLAGLDARRQVIADAQAALDRSLRELDLRSADLAAKLPRTMVVREAEALMAEQQTVAARRNGIEDEGLALLEEDDELDDSVGRSRVALEAAQDRLATASDALARAEAALQVQKTALVERRAETAAPVPEELLARYDQLRAGHEGVAVAHLVGGRCDGCHLALAQAALERIRSAPPDELVECEECGRLLVR